jgi:uncharacterized membrane protein YqjE
VDYESRQRRLDRAYDAMLTELFVGFLVTLLTWFLWVASPGYMGPMFYEPSLFETLPVVQVLCTIGWIWMLRLSRPRPEQGERSWRYRDQAG